MIDASQMRGIIEQALAGEKPATDLLLSLADWLQLQPRLPVGAASDIQERYEAYHIWLQAEDGGIIVNLEHVL